MNPKIRGIVVRGDGYGRKLGFPTVNLATTEVLPSYGVYAGVATLEEKKYKAGIVISPTEKMESKVEAHLMGYTGDAYGKTVILEVGKFLREYKKFDSEAELINQIKKDIEQC